MTYSPYLQRENGNGTKILGKSDISKETKGKKEEIKHYYYYSFLLFN